MADLRNRVAIVTGGANGIGEATAHALARDGAAVVIADKDSAQAAAVASEIGAAGGQALAVATDVTEREQVDALVSKVLRRWGRIDILDNNAAALELTAHDGDILHLETETLVDTLRGNVVAAYLMTRAVLPTMLAQRKGAIVNIASISGMAGEPTLTAYGVSKAALIQLTRAVAVQYGKQGIRCNAVAPAYVRTRNNAQYAPPQLEAIYTRNMATPETALPRDIADVVTFLASDQARMITGHVVPVDGGITDTSPINADLSDWSDATAAVTVDRPSDR